MSNWGGVGLKAMGGVLGIMGRDGRRGGGFGAIGGTRWRPEGWGTPTLGGGGGGLMPCPLPSQVDRMVALSRLRQSGAFLTTSESLVLQLLRDSSHPRFRQVRPRPLCVATPPYFNGPRPQAHLAPQPPPTTPYCCAYRFKSEATPTRAHHAHTALWPRPQGHPPHLPTRYLCACRFKNEATPAWPRPHGCSDHAHRAPGLPSF